MCSLPGLHQPEEPKSIELYALNKAMQAAVKPFAARKAEGRSKRAKTWDVHSSYHCSIVGTCLSTEELRQILVKAGEPGVRSASEHALHIAGVKLAGRRDVASKLLNKALERKHANAIRQADRLATIEELRHYWRDAFEKGDVAGPYWAVLGHPAAGIDLMTEVFGEVHMLSHLLGSAGRADMVRMKNLEAANSDMADAIARQEKRLVVATARQETLQRQVDDLQSVLLTERARNQKKAEVQPHGSGDRIWEKRHAVEKARADDLTAMLAEVREFARAAEERAAKYKGLVESLERENNLIEAKLVRDAGPDMADNAGAAPGETVLYVGGRRRMFDRLRKIASEREVILNLHDGGLEDSTTLLPASVAQADKVVFPVDHISHSAMELVKRLCNEAGKPFIPMRTAGLASFLAALSTTN